MAFFQLMLKARKLEKARLAYQDEKLRSIEISRGGKVHYTLSQKIRRKKIMLKRKCRSCWKKATSCPENSWFHRKAVLLRTEGTFENFIMKSVMGFLGGIFLTYMFFMFFVFQLNFALSSATLLCSLFGIILTIGLAFSYRVRCVVFLLLPQFFSKRGRQALMAYAFILALTGPAKNTLHNTGVLSESLACGQEQLKEAVKTIVDLIKQPFYALKDAIAKVIKTVKIVVKRIKQALMAIKRMILSILRVIKAVFQWLGSVVNICNKKLGTPFERCQRSFDGAVSDCYAKLGPIFGTVCNLAYVAGSLCYIVKPLDFICMLVSYVSDTIVGSVRKKIKKFTKHMNAMFYVKVKFSHSFHFETNKSRSLEEISTGIVTEIRSRTEKFLTVFDWMSFATSFFVLFMLLRVIHYRQKWLTNERFDNRYLTDDLRHIDLIRAKKDKETVLPLNPREKNKYIPLTSITLIRVEKIKLTKSAVFLLLTTCKLCIHMIADYSLYWVLSTIRYHGRFETKVQRTNAVGVYVSGNGYLAQLYRSIVRAFSPLGTDMEMDTVPCLPDPVPPDLDKYTQIVSLIVFCWIMAFFEPYGLRLRHVVMTYYHPERAKQRAVWLYNHIIRSRGSFLKYARRQLRRKFGMNDGKAVEEVTLKERIFAMCPILNNFFNQKENTCLLCGTAEHEGQLPHVKCPTPGCVGLFCIQCFADLQNLCTICRAPMDYGDLSDMSEEKDSSDDQHRHPRQKKLPPNFRKKPEEAETPHIDDDYSPEIEKKKLLSNVSKLDDDDHETDREFLYDEKSTKADEEFSDDSVSSEYSQSYQYEDRKKMDTIKHRKPYKDVEAQRLHDDVTIQIFNEPLIDDTTSGTESPTSCFVVRAQRKLRSRFKRKCRSWDSKNSSSSSSTSIADTEYLPTEDVEEEEVLHIEIEDDSGNGIFGAGGSKILNKKPGRLRKIVDVLNKISWLQKKTSTDQKTAKGFQSRRPSLMKKVVDMLQSKSPTARVNRPYESLRKSKSDGEQFENFDSSSSSLGSYEDEENYEKRALIGSHSERTDRGNRRKKSKKNRREKSKKNRRCYRGGYSDDYIYETSWESHRQRGGSKTPFFVPNTNKYNEERNSRIAKVMSKGTKYYEINEKALNKLSDCKSSSETGKMEDAWNIKGSEEKNDTASSFSRSSHGNNEKNGFSRGMTTIAEDSKELSITDNQTETGNSMSINETDAYVDVTGFSSNAESARGPQSVMKKSGTKYVTEDEWAATTSEERKRRKKSTKRRREARSIGPDLYDPLAGLEIYGLNDKEVKQKSIPTKEAKSKVRNANIDESEDPEKNDNFEISRSEAKTQTKTRKRNSPTENSDTDLQLSSTDKEQSDCQDGRQNYIEYRRHVKRMKMDTCKKHKKSRRKKKEKNWEQRRTLTSPDSDDIFSQHKNHGGKRFGTEVQTEQTDSGRKYGTEVETGESEAGRTYGTQVQTDRTDCGRTCGTEMQTDCGRTYGTGVQTDCGRTYGTGVQTDCGRQYGTEIKTDCGRQYGTEIKTDCGRTYGTGVQTDCRRQYGTGVQTDCGRQYGTEIQTDCGRTYGTGVQTDCRRQYGTEIKTDCGRQYGTEIKTDCGRQYGTGVQTDCGRQYGPKIQTDCRRTYGTEIETDCGRQYGTEIETDCGRQYGTEIKTDCGRQYGTEIQTDCGRTYGTEIQTDCGKQYRTGMQTDCGRTYGTEIQTDCGRRFGPKIQTDCGRQYGTEVQTDCGRQYGPKNQTDCGRQYGPRIQTDSKRTYGPKSRIDCDGRAYGTQIQPAKWFYEEQRKLWEQMCAKMTEYSHRLGYPDSCCAQPAPRYTNKNCRIPMYDPNQLRPQFQGYQRPSFPPGPSNFCESRPVPPVLQKFLPIFQRPELVEELKARDKRKLIKERKERERKRDSEQMTRESLEMLTRRQQESSSKKILSRPSIIPERPTDVLPYQETESFRNVVNEYRAMTIPQIVEESSPDDEEAEEKIHHHPHEPLINLSKIADKTKIVQQLFPPLNRKRASVVAKFTNKIANVFKSNRWTFKKAKDQSENDNIAETETLSEVSTSPIDSTRGNKSGETTSAETTDNNETTE